MNGAWPFSFTARQQRAEAAAGQRRSGGRGAAQGRGEGLLWLQRSRVGLPDQLPRDVRVSQDGGNEDGVAKRRGAGADVEPPM